MINKVIFKLETYLIKIFGVSLERLQCAPASQVVVVVRCTSFRNVLQPQWSWAIADLELRWFGGSGPNRHAICGRTPEDRAATRMWIRNIEARINDPLTNGFRWAEGLRMFEKRRHCVPQAADDMKAIAREGLA